MNAIRVLGVLELLGFHLVELRCVQEAMRRAYYERDSERGLYATFAWLVEEVGELAEALLSRDYSRVEEEIADIVAWTLSIANLVGVDVEEALRKKYLSDLETASCD
ncbi:MAG: MazG nucleotide pyrophosphohydrolase domain-containing protein [Acidilobaceae archaeon]